MKTSDILYRQLTGDDLGHVAMLEAACFPTPWTADQYRVLLRHGGCSLFGALCSDALAGYIAVAVQGALQDSARASPNVPTGEMEIYNIAVDAPFRRQGVGKRLLSLALEAAARYGVAQTILEVRISNLPALSLYRSLGFAQVGVRRGYYHDTGEDALVFARSLQ